jgi:hypothetical protein
MQAACSLQILQVQQTGLEYGSSYMGCTLSRTPPSGVLILMKHDF